MAQKRNEVANKRVLVGGLFSAKEDSAARMAELASVVAERGGTVVGHFVQRRGVSRGGVKKMSNPLSQRTLFSSGKATEIASACRSSDAQALVIHNELTDRQRANLAAIAGIPVLSLSELREERLL